jgi:hypothetical protein
VTYYIANNLDLDTIICDSCGEQRWQTHPKYGTNVDARLDEAQETGVRWGWDRAYSSKAQPCSICKEMTK